MRARYGTWVVLAALLLAAAPALLAQESPETAGPNIRITLTVGGSDDQGGRRERIYRLVTRPGVRTEMLMGWRTPIPAKRREVTNEGEAPATTYTYQNIGVSTSLEVRMLGPDRMSLNGVIEVSGPKGGATAEVSPDAPPIIGTFQQNIAVSLQNGKVLRVAEVPDHEGGSLFLDLRADIEE